MCKRERSGGEIGRRFDAGKSDCGGSGDVLYWEKENGGVSMGQIYLDNGSTTFPKPAAVAEAMYRYLTESGSNVGRGAYDRAYAVEERVYETRELLCALFHGGDCRNVIFTKNVTESINVLLKGLLGPRGVGGFLLSPELVSQITPLLSGGTGSISHTEEVPDFMPDRFEPGTPNLPGIVGLHAALLWLEETGMDAIRAHELGLTARFLSGVDSLGKAGRVVRAVGLPGTEGRTGVVSVVTPDRDMAGVAYELDSAWGIMTRVGLHCAPSAHKTLGTFPAGTIRFSFGWWNTEEEVDRAIDALDAILREAAR